jgi:1,2-diacylglycerol 3-beta-galactosyltransferase
LLFTIIRSMVKEHKPDAIVTTHPFYMAPLNAYITLRKLPIPFLTVITDMTNVHRLWFNQGSEYCLLPTREAYEEALLSGMTAEVCRVTGIPVNPVFYTEKRSKAELRTALGWNVDGLAALVVGSKRIKNLKNVLHLLNHSGLPIQLVLVAGGDNDLFEYFRSTEWHLSSHIYNFVENMPEFMKAADIYIGKAGGLAVTESLACGLPLLLVDVTPGQEEGNLSYVISHEAGEYARNPIQALEILSHWLQRDQKVLQQKSFEAARLGKPKAAFDIADLAWLAAEKGRTVPSSRLMTWIPKFREILRSFEISDTTDN